MNKPKFLPAKLAGAKLVPWKKAVALSVFKLSAGSKAGVVVDKKGSPRLFIFDTDALLDILSAVDDPLADKLSDKEYHSKLANPAGWLIDELESKLPLNDEYIDSLKSAIVEAEKKGWVPFEKIRSALSL